MDNPAVSVIMPAFNAERFIDEAIRSILSQTFRDFEFLIIDDGSSDRTPAILAEYARKDPRIRVLRNEQNAGIVVSLNRGLAEARGRYVARQDADDTSFPNRIERQVAFLDEHPGVVAVTSEVLEIDAEGRTLRASRRRGDAVSVAWRLLFHNYFYPHSAVTFRLAPVRELGGYREAFRHCEDYDLWTRLAEVGDLVILPDTLLRYRVHSQSVSQVFTSVQTPLTLEVSARELGRLLGTGVPAGRAADLRAFWEGRSSESFEIIPVHRMLARAYRAFLLRRKERGADLAALARSLRQEIAGAFLDWAPALAAQGRREAGLKALCCGFWWHPRHTAARIAMAAGKRIRKRGREGSA